MWNHPNTLCPATPSSDSDIETEITWDAIMSYAKSIEYDRITGALEIAPNYESIQESSNSLQISTNIAQNNILSPAHSPRMSIEDSEEQFPGLYDLSDEMNRQLLDLSQKISLEPIFLYICCPLENNNWAAIDRFLRQVSGNWYKVRPTAWRIRVARNLIGFLDDLIEEIVNAGLHPTSIRREIVPVAPLGDEFRYPYHRLPPKVKRDGLVMNLLGRRLLTGAEKATVYKPNAVRKRNRKDIRQFMINLAWSSHLQFEVTPPEATHSNNEWTLVRTDTARTSMAWRDILVERFLEMAHYDFSNW